MMNVLQLVPALRTSTHLGNLGIKRNSEERVAKGEVKMSAELEQPLTISIRHFFIAWIK